ncbi:MAG: Lon protease family protein [Spirochaetaceae bacterium]
MINELTGDQTRRTVNPEGVPFGGTEKAEANGQILGQDRAIKALQFGLQVEGDGFNIYVAGPPGIGKKTSVQGFVEELARNRTTPDDWCFVHNHQEPYEPRAVRLNPGQGKEFGQDIKELKEFMEREIPSLFESDEYSSQREETLQEIQTKGQNAQAEVREKAQEKGFVMQQTFMGTALVPVKDGEPLRDEDLQKLPEEERKAIEERRNELQEEMKQIQKRTRKLDREAREKVKELDRNAVLARLEGPLEDLKEKYEDHKEVEAYLNDIKDDVLENIDTLKSDPEQQGQQVPPQIKQQIIAVKQQFFKKYQVNVVVDNSRQEGAPVITELNPTYNNLIGRIEKEMQMGALSTDFTLIKPGALLRANGGFLVLTIDDILKSPYSWEGLKRALKSNVVRIEEVQEQLGLMSIKTLRPQPIPLDVKVILIGRPLIYNLLHQLDPDVQELFKVKADFDVVMESSDENQRAFVNFLASTVRREKLKDLDRTGVAAMLEHAYRIAEDKERISTRFGELSDVLREAGYWAAAQGAGEISGEHVRRALEAKIYRSSMIKEKIVELIERGTLLIETRGESTGQVNGLSVMMLGNVAFGRPNRITATVAAGRDGVIDIERESKLGGPIHNKGVQVLTGFLQRTFARHFALSMSARLVFEQSYTGVDGDSASSAELYALLSELASLPIRQSVAVTGSVNQNGEIQAIGGVNEKVEGFYDVCSVNGLTGEQGVMIPESNVKNLMLRRDVAHAVENGSFHIWPVRRVSEGIEVLTGEAAGSRDENGRFPEASLFGRVEKKLADYQGILRSFGDRERGE